MLVPQLLGRYPTNVFVKLEESKDPTIPWMVATLQKTISQYIKVQENAHHYGAGGKKFAEVTFLQPSAEVFASNVNDTRVLLPCIFCKGSPL